ncbi:unnamed protein product [Cuscuta europaea]|uniref:Uncharacterized protein n=1 Tax=Cuscuta europaea TaxID=41803 RepID=A0A9P0YYB2_CUSEU|nr:unnamed protein product [Cuscuta europaea]
MHPIQPDVFSGYEPEDTDTKKHKRSKIKLPKNPSKQNTWNSSEATFHHQSISGRPSILLSPGKNLIVAGPLPSPDLVTVHAPQHATTPAGRFSKGRCYQEFTPKMQSV